MPPWRAGTGSIQDKFSIRALIDDIGSPGVGRRRCQGDGVVYSDSIPSPRHELIDCLRRAPIEGIGQRRRIAIAAHLVLPFPVTAPVIVRRDPGSAPGLGGVESIHNGLAIPEIIDLLEEP